jgi:hypothetical protein
MFSSSDTGIEKESYEILLAGKHRIEGKFKMNNSSRETQELKGNQIE